ncbi:MAG: SDR family NAD(P)-dependent oxidoreductase [Myxococcota bacterium]|nr:SDR family NAD(P)-dependent oxidoreductase [Myxococcota bacterium]
MDDYQGKTVVVTGGRGALGRALVDCLLGRGAACFVPDLHPVLDENPVPGLSIRGPVDLTDERSVIEFFDRIPDVWASFHVAGGFAMGPIAETSADTFRGLFELNALTAFLSCREAVRRMRATGIGGRIVNVIAKPVLAPAADLSAYTASKAAVAALTETLAEELAHENIFVNAVAPSIMDTAANRAAMPNANHDDWPKVQDVAQVMADLGSPQNRVARGTLMPVYGALG